jgi:hypothetical protein
MPEDSDNDSCLATRPIGTAGSPEYVPGLLPADVRLSGGTSTSSGSPSLETIPGGRVTPTGSTSPATSDRIDSTASGSPTSNMSSIASASATGPVDGDAENAGFVLEISHCMFIFGIVVGIGGSYSLPM